MQKYIIILSLLVISCSDEKEFDFNCDDILPEKNVFVFYLGALDITAISDPYVSVDVVEGSNIVFDYIHEDEDCLTAVDDEVGLRIQFELAPTTNFINLRDEELQNVNCTLSRTGSWAPGSIMLTEGHLKAQRKSETEWEVSLTTDVDRFGVSEFSINEKFTLR